MAKPTTRSSKSSKHGATGSKSASGKSKVDVQADTPKPRVPKLASQSSRVALEIQAAVSNALPRPMKVRQEHPDISENTGGKLSWADEAFVAFFADEIDMLTSERAEIFNDREARWRCDCCDAVIRIPRRTVVYHGDYEVVHDDQEGVLVNGERHVPKAYTDVLEVVQPGRLRNPWTGRLIEGNDLGTTGTA